MALYLSICCCQYPELTISATLKDLDDLGKQLYCMTEEVLPRWRKTPLQQLSRSRTRQHSEFERIQHKMETTGSLKNRITKVEFLKQHLKKPLQSWNNILLTKSPNTRVDGRVRVRVRAHDIQNIPPHQWSMVVVVSWCVHVWLPVKLISLYVLMMWLLTNTAGWSLKCFKQYYLLIFSRMLQK